MKQIGACSYACFYTDICEQGCENNPQFVIACGEAEAAKQMRQMACDHTINKRTYHVIYGGDDYDSYTTVRCLLCGHEKNIY